MQSTIKAKLLRNLGANAYGQVITILSQLVSVPLFLHYWGLQLYGEWLILSAIPAYLALSDIGFGSVAANDMTMRVVRNDREGALRVYQSIWVFVSSISLITGILFLIGIYIAPVVEVFSIKQISDSKIRYLLIVLVLYVLVGLQGNVLNAAFRSVGQYAYGTALGNTVRLAEWVLSMVALMIGGGVLIIASVTLITRTLGFLLMWLEVKKKIPWLVIGTKNASLRQIKELLRPAIAFMIFPLGLAFSLQGMVLIVGMSLGAAAVVAFSAYRTLSRLLVQVVTMLNHSVWPEISAAYGANQLDLVSQLHRKGSCVSLWISVLGVTGLGSLGAWFIKIWTHDAFEANQVLFLLLLLTTFLNVMWQTSWVVLMATNQHQKIAAAFIVSATSGLLAAWLILPVLGINGAGLVLVLAEIPMLYFAINSAIHLLKDSWPVYLRAVFNKPQIRF